VSFVSRLQTVISTRIRSSDDASRFSTESAFSCCARRVDPAGVVGLRRRKERHLVQGLGCAALPAPGHVQRDVVRDPEKPRSGVLDLAQTPVALGKPKEDLLDHVARILDGPRPPEGEPEDRPR
jgi:hypothetical protein